MLAGNKRALKDGRACVWIRLLSSSWEAACFAELPLLGLYAIGSASESLSLSQFFKMKNTKARPNVNENNCIYRGSSSNGLGLEA